MKYYIITKDVFESLEKENIKYMKRNIANTQVIISTTVTVDSTIKTFDTAEDCSTYTFTNHVEWVGDNTGVEVWELDDNYIIELDN